MKANELMIGDWVYSTFCDKPCKVIGIEQYESEYVNVKVTNVTGAKDINSIYFIPLTADILEKNGLIKDEDRGKDFGQTYHILIPTGYEARSFTVQVTIYKEPIQGVDVLFKCWGWIPPFNGGLDDIHLCSLKYVHQIQHALRLCGIDKEMVL